MKHWWYSLLTAAVYLATFWYWKQFPSRIGFVVSGLAVAILLAVGLVFAARRSYFVDTVDRNIHLLVILDLILESTSYEGVLWYASTSGTATTAPDAAAGVAAFHNNYNFLGCAAAFAIVIGGYRWFRFHKQRGFAVQARAANAS